jgi:para-aminobenzoate synthetase component I
MGEGQLSPAVTSMRTLVEPIATAHTPESLRALVASLPGAVVLRTQKLDVPAARFSFVAAEPFLTFRSTGSSCVTATADGVERQFGNPWGLLGALVARFELLDDLDLPFPLGGAFGWFGYDLKQFLEPRLSRRAADDLELPDCHLAFFDSLVVFDHVLGQVSVVSTGLGPDGTRSESAARRALATWRSRLESPVPDPASIPAAPTAPGAIASSFTRDTFIASVRRVQRYIRSGDVYQANLAQRLSVPWAGTGWDLFERLGQVSPAPFAACFDAGDFSVVSSSPELFLRLSGSHILTRPIKGTRPRSADPVRDAQLTYELQRSEKEMAELVMITDLLRNDLGRVCEFGSVQVPELVRLERYAQVQHLVSTVEGRLRPAVSHLDALGACFPGGSITGAPKIRAMEIIDELEPVARGPYTGALGYLGFNRESQFSIAIRMAVVRGGRAWFHVGAGIVADSVPEAEYEETWAKAGGLLAALGASRETQAAEPARTALA